MSHTSLHLFKQNFKFSSAHFLIFDEKRAERLHGHNYQVRVDLQVPAKLPAHGYFVDFAVFKKIIKDQLDLWDEHVLLPAQHPDIQTTVKGSSLELRFRDRFYAFPKNEVILLPLTNTSVEQLSQLLARAFWEKFHALGVTKVRVMVEETRGQGASSVVDGD